MGNSDRKLRVLHILKGMDIGAVNGGAEGFGLKLACALDANRFDVRVCAFFRVGSPVEAEWAAKLSDRGVEWFHAADWRGNDQFGEYMQGVRALRRYAANKPLDVVNGHFQLGNLAALDLKFRGHAASAVRTTQLMPEAEWSKGLYGWARYQVLTRFFFPVLFDAEVGVSRAVVDALDHHLGARLFRRRAKLIHNAVTIPAWRENLDISKDAPLVIGVIGRLAEQKGHRYLIEALRMIHPEVPQLKVWFIGDGELRSELEAQASRAGLSQVIAFLGRRNDVPELLQQMHLLVLPSLYEGFPINVLEGMAAGVPVIATDIPGTRELVRPDETGWLVPARDAEALGKRILQVMGDSQSVARIRGQAYAEMERYSIETTAARYAALYETLAAGK